MVLYYNKKSYPSRSLAIPGYGRNMIIATTYLRVSLDKQLNKGQAKAVGAIVFCYVTPEEFQLSDKELIKLIQKNYTGNYTN